MSRGSGEGDSAAGGMRLGGEVTGRVQVGRFVLEVGSPAGMRADFAAGPAAESSALRIALSQPESPGALAGSEEAVDDAESVTGKVERALELFTALAQGKILDRRVFLKEVDVLLGALERLDREGRHRDALRLARVLAALLALATRWIALVESLRLALRAARALGDAQGIAWARHELGTLFLGADDAAAANRELRESLRHPRGDRRQGGRGSHAAQPHHSPEGVGGERGRRSLAEASAHRRHNGRSAPPDGRRDRRRAGGARRGRRSTPRRHDRPEGEHQRGTGRSDRGAERELRIRGRRGGPEVRVPARRRPPSRNA